MWYIIYYNYTFNHLFKDNIFIVFPAYTNEILGFSCILSTINYAASIFLIATNPGPNLLIAADTNWAASASPSALIIVALVSSSYL